MAWIEPEDVAAQLDLLETDTRLEQCTEAVKIEVERLRSDLAPYTTMPANVHYGAVLWAALYYQHRNAPSGFAGFGDGADLVGEVMGSRKADIYRLIGLRRPVTA
jgi:hypothetical protein